MASQSIILKSGTDWQLLVPVRRAELLTAYQIRAVLVGPNGNRIGPYLVDGLGKIQRQSLLK
jgi:hypothetical protein